MSEPVMVAIPRRQVTAGERAVLAVLVAATGSAQLRAQLDDVAVRGVCRCGCSSIQLAGGGPPVPPSEVLRLTGGVREDHLSVSAVAGEPDGPVVAVVLHVVNGLLIELELYAGTASGTGEGAAVPVPAAESLREVHVGL